MREPALLMFLYQKMVAEPEAWRQHKKKSFAKWCTGSKRISSWKLNFRQLVWREFFLRTALKCMHVLSCKTRKFRNLNIFQPISLSSSARTTLTAPTTPGTTRGPTPACSSTTATRCRTAAATASPGRGTATPPEDPEDRGPTLEVGRCGGAKRTK